MLLLGAPGIRTEIDHVVGEDTGPDEVYLEHVDIVAARAENLLVGRQALTGVVGRGHQLDRVTGAGRPRLGALLAHGELGADSAARDGDLHALVGRDLLDGRVRLTIEGAARRTEERGQHTEQCASRHRVSPRPHRWSVDLPAFTRAVRNM